MSKKILLVEDEALIALHEAQMLKKHGYEVVTAYNGEKAIKTVDSDPEISLILMDIDLGKGMDGTETAERILSKKDIPVVFLSSHTEPEVVEKTEKITSYGYVVKNSGATVLDASIKMAFRLFDARMKEKEKEIKLIESEKRSKTIVTSMSDLIMVLDSDDRFLEVYSSPNKKLYISYENFLGKQLYEVMPKHISEQYRQASSSVRHTGETSTFEYPIEIGESVYWLLATLDLHEDQESLVCNIRDITNRKRMEERLRNSEEKYHSIFNTTMNAILLVDKETGFIIDANPAAEKMYGYSRDELLHLKPWDISAEPEETRTMIQQFESDDFTVNERIHKRRDGTPFSVEICASQFTMGEKQIRLGTLHDITERKRIEAELRQSEERARAVIETAEDSIFIKDMSGEYTMVNPAMEKLFGRESKDIIGKTDYDLFGEEAGKAVNEADTVVYEGKIVEEFPAKPINGTLHTFHTIKVPLHDSEGTISGLCGIARDITKRKQAEETLKAKNNLLERIFANNIDLIALTDLEGNYKTAGKAHEILGYEREYLIGKNVMDFVHPDDVSFVNREFSDFIQSGETSRIEYRYRRIEGEYLWFETTGTILKDKNGNPEQILFNTRDITERKLAKDNFREALKEKDFLMKELNHRVKNNLLMVSSLINLKDSETEADLSDIRHQIEAIGLIHEKLFQTGNVTGIDFRDYIRDLLNSIFSSFSKRPVRIEANIDAISIPTKQAMSLGLIVNEIATNAIKHGFNEKEAAVFSVNMKEDKENSRYELTLSNTGNPFPKDIDVENPQTLGLRLISALTAQLGGTVELQREPHPVFTIRFPAQGSTYKNSAGRPAK